jgi:anaerobic sulfite reductase subunit B
VVAAGVGPGAVQVSLERNMQCGVGHCGHCQLGPLFTCVDGPVVDWATASPLLAVRER